MPDSRGVIPGHGPSDDVLDILLPHRGRQTKTTPDDASSDTNTNTNTDNLYPSPMPQSFLKQHFCLAVPTVADVAAWEDWFRESGVRVTGTVDWPKGGRSVYFADLDGNVGEVGSRGIWDHY
ncbi:uncharacterized protein A1O9_09777 [Exophiala aquamarina CBS 119918]|uniref:Glyoxalase/fosfomycin resistance/dioxygenase domain-containing protein n=1 Tax=Exophiala aquamarina CBS 119918 TaxID=1182545 RepID=A0A072P2Q5_9EURO|nr:uncharacterized protein A1O9_09777 [Exophiala aquamarina CBS 119918]KEF53982.1 hypothetical protein A1O9_09777 [Exophiala aquamarina CBS 119918]